MPTTIEVSSRTIRLCREDNRRIIALESFPVPEGADPLEVLASAPLPGPLGRVRLILHHGDMLLRSTLQPPCPPERLARIMRFELASAGEGEPVVSSWHLIRTLGGDDMRLLTLVTKRRLIAQVKQALKPHGGRLDSLVHPTIALFQSYRSMALPEPAPAVLLDVGGAHVHVSLVQDGELIFTRTQGPGMDELVKHIAELRSLAMPDAAALVAKLGKGAPADLHEAIKRQVGQIAGIITANLRFAKAQLRIEQFEPKVIWLTGAGGQVYGFSEQLASRTGMMVRPINPFAGALTSLSSERLDRLAILPSAYGVVLGASRAKAVELDALDEEKEERREFWRTDGVLRAAAVLVATLLILAFVRQQVATGTANTAIGVLDGEGGGLVPKAQAARKELDQIADAKAQTAARLVWLDGERRPGRVAAELLSAIADAQDPVKVPVVVQNYRVDRRPGQVQVEIEGFAQAVGTRSTDSVLHAFEQSLIKRYGPITAIKQVPKPIDGVRQNFHYQLAINDLPAVVGKPEAATVDGKPALKLAITVPPGIDFEGAARVAALRAHQAESSAVVKVTSSDPADKTSRDVTVLFKD